MSAKSSGTPPELKKLLDTFYTWAHKAGFEAGVHRPVWNPKYEEDARAKAESARSAVESLFLASQEEIARLRGIKPAERMFPIQGWKSIPWSIAEKAYADYSRRFGKNQSLERLAERGGFGAEEMDDHYPPWREESDEITQLRAELSRLRTSQLSQTEAWYLEEDVHIPHTPECTFWTEDKCDECTCISGRIREKIARIMSAVPQEKTYDP